MSKRFSFFAGVLVVLTALLSVSVLAPVRPSIPDAEAQGATEVPRVAASKATRTEEENRTIAVYKKVNDAVVFISTVVIEFDPYDMFSELSSREGTGSGFVFDAERGLILTNAHVLQSARQVFVMFRDGERREADVLGYDHGYDIAVLRLKEKVDGLVAAPLGDAGSVEVGQRVLAIGNPFGLNRTLTTGIVSSLDRTVKSPTGAKLRGLIQTDAAINPGNSGGPLLDADGRVIGITTAILSQSGDSAGIGFAMPINPIRAVLGQLISKGRVLRPTLGVLFGDTNLGPVVRRIQQGGPADRAGLQPLERIVDTVFRRGIIRDPERADVLVSVNGKRVSSVDEVDEALASAEPDTPIEVVVRRGGRRGTERSVTIEPEYS